MAKGGMFMEKARRCVRTVFFMVAMVASLLVSSLPVLVAIGDVLVPCVLISSFTCVTCFGFKEHLHRYAFKSSLVDVPLVSFIRSLIITCVYPMCDGPSLSHGPYLGTVTICSFTSILVLSIKVCVFTVNSQIEAEASTSPSRQKLHLKKSWGMPVLFLSSVVFALGHTVVAYRTSCRARRKLMFHRVDPEAVLSCKTVFSGYQKVPRSPTPSGGKTPKSDSEMRRKPFATAREEGELPIRVVADIDSLFITCRGLTLHYKISLPGSPPRSLSSVAFHESNISCSSPKAGGRPKLDRHPLSLLSKGQNHLHRSYSNQFHGSSLYIPLLDGSSTSPALTEEIPLLRLADDGDQDEGSKLNSGNPNNDMEGSGQFGIVLVHGFGGGVFSWRHVMGTLARQVGCTVAAFDRPGWGLTSRLRREDWEDKEMPNPYKLDSQKRTNKLTEGRRSDFFNHLKSAADSFSALAWIAYTGKECGMSMPIAHVEESWQMAEFYNNKVLVEYKSKDPNHVEWAKAMKELYLPGLREYVKSFYPLGPVWSPTGAAVTSAPSKPKAPAPGAPAPPPAPSASLFSSETSQASSSRPKQGMAAVFQEINSGKPVTTGLRKVTDDMKTKNRADRTGVVGTKEKESHTSAPAVSKVGPPKFELQMGRKWAVENQIGKKNLVISECDAKQSVYVYGCKDSVLQIQGKVNNITLDKCTKMGVVFQDVVAAFEIVNCNRVEVQCQGSAPTVSIDNTSGCQFYLSKDALSASITTAKSSEVNILVPGAEPDGDWGEHALPEQFIHVYKDGRFETTPVSHSAGG